MSAKVTLLDGGMGRELLRRGAPFRQPEWSALAITEAPQVIALAHDAFVAAGADVITTNSFAVVPFHIGEGRFAAEGKSLAQRTGEIARASAAKAHRSVRIAASIPPPFGAYRPDLFEPDRARPILKTLIEGLAPVIDIWLAETQSSIAEAEAVRQALGADRRPLWLSFTLDDNLEESPPILRSGESVADATMAANRLGASALLFNCSQPEVIGAAVDVARMTTLSLGARLELGAYANAFPPQPKNAQANVDLDELREDITPERYADFAKSWVERGATIVGGCCGIGPEHIRQLHAVFSSS